MELRIERPIPQPPPPPTKIVMELEQREARILEMWLGQMPESYSHVLRQLRENLHELIELIAQLLEEKGIAHDRHYWQKKGA